MSMEFKLPELGEGIEAATVVNVLVSVGDVIQKDQNLIELETDKATIELPAPASGKITAIQINKGDEIKVGQILMLIETAEGAVAPPPAEPVAQAAEEKPPIPTPQATPQSVSAPAPVAAPKIAATPSTPGMAPVPAGPATRRLARKLDVNLGSLQGTGPSGRINPEDVAKAYAKAQGGGGPTLPEMPDFTAFGTIERHTLNRVRKTAVGRLSRSWQLIPAVTQHDLADITELEKLRKKYNAAKDKSKPKITMTAIVVKSVVSALRKFPEFNSSFDHHTNEVILKKYYHIGVAADTEHGLMVPVIRNADQKNIVEIANELTVLANKARNLKLAPNEMTGATFTISNLGGIGGTAFTPIVNWPEVAILGLSRSQMRLRYIDGQPVERMMLPLSLSYDHRVVNGADAARFIVRLNEILSDAISPLFEI